MSITYKTSNNICYLCKYHVVWCPKYRKQILKDNVEKRLKQIVAEVCKEKQSDLIEIECDKDHIRILVEVDPQYGIHKLIKQIKGVSSKKLREEFLFLKRVLPTLWTNSYFVSTAGEAPISMIKQYIEKQKTRYKEIKMKGWKNNGRTKI